MSTQEKPTEAADEMILRANCPPKGCQIVASVSGGKDSTALCLFMKELGLEYRAVHMDTGWEHPKTDKYLRDVLPKYIGPIEWIIPEKGMVELIRHKQMFPSRTIRFCTQFLKIFPIQDFIEREYVVDVINAVGIRADESLARSNLREYEDIEWATVWRPLLSWTTEDVIAIHKRHNCPPNPLYLEGQSRVGCWPCIFARKSEIRTVADTDPSRIDLIRALEFELGRNSKLRWENKNMTTTKECQPPTFFSLKQNVCGKVKNVGTKIDDVIKWSRTAHGGKQFELFHTYDRSSCMRWGLCDY